MSNRRLILACRVVAGTILAGCASVATGLVTVRTYGNEVEYAKNATEDAKRFKPHRCNDRLSDMLEVIESEDGSIIQDFRPAFRHWWACMRSKEGEEPDMPYLMLTARDKQYISPEQRRLNRQAATVTTLSAD